MFIETLPNGTQRHLAEIGRDPFFSPFYLAGGSASHRFSLNPASFPKSSHLRKGGTLVKVPPSENIQRKILYSI